MTALPIVPPSPQATEAWPTLRYDRILPLAKHGRRTARLCATLVGTVEFLIDPVRREVASRRIARALAMSARRARSTFRAGLISEALEEAEIVFLMAHPEALGRTFSAHDDEPSHCGRTIYATLHLGSPILAYLHLAWWRRLDVTIIGRTLAAENPVPEAKRRHGRRRVAWVDDLSRPFLGIDAASVTRARALLLDGASLFAPLDVPGDVVGRSAEVDVFGERVRFASGMVTLARLTGAALRPVVALSRPHGVVVQWGQSVEPGDDPTTLAAVFRELLAFVRQFPGEWWMWPYLVKAPDSGERAPRAGGPSAVTAQ